MRAAERGMLMLCCTLGDHSVKPLTPAEFLQLEKVFQRESADSGEVTVEALRGFGIAEENAWRIVRLLDREAQLQAYLSRAERHGIGVMTRLSEDYPPVLLQKLGDHAPMVLFYRGDPALFIARCVSLVGSRRLMPLGEAFAKRVGALCAVEGRTLVSGGAMGADRAAQKACQALEGEVIVFVADSLEEHPEQNGALYVSEEGFDVPFSTPRAHSRNRLIHAMGERVFVAQCSHGKGGTWAGTVENLKKGISPVYCHDDGSEAVRELEQLGAELISYDDMTSVLFPEKAVPMEEYQQTFEVE